MFVLRIVGLSLFGLASLSAQASEFETQPTLGWTVHFGGTALSAPALSVGLRGALAGADATAPNLVQLDLAVSGTGLRVAGLPLVTRRYRLGQAEYGTDGRVAEDPAPKPWYARSWVLWTGAGLAATAALAGSGGGSENRQVNCDGNCNGENGVSGDVIGPNDLCLLEGGDPSNDVCTNPGFVAASRGSLPADRPSDLDAGSGGMGDLIAR